jgi:hypothetical protein
MKFQGTQAMGTRKELSESRWVGKREGYSGMSDLLNESQPKRLRTEKQVDDMELEQKSSSPSLTGKSTLLVKNLLKSAPAIHPEATHFKQLSN